MQNATKILLIATAICVALYVGVFIGRSSLTQTVYLPAVTTIDTDSIGVLDLNRAGIEDLSSLPGVSRSLAKEIIQYRKDYGDYVSVRELLNVDSMTKELYESIRQYLTVD